MTAARLAGAIAAGRALVRNPDRQSIALGFVDQAFSSATNFALSLMAGRLLGPAGLGEVFLGFSIYLIGLELQRRLLTEPVLASTAGADSERRRETSGYTLTVAIVVGGCASAAAAVAGLLLPGLPGRGVLLIAPWLLATMLQDVVRNIFFRDGRPAAAAVNDGIWFVVMALSVVPAWQLGTAEAVMASWALGALAAAVVGTVQLGVRPSSIRDSFRWWRRDALPFGKWNAGAAVVYQVGSNAVVFILAGILGTAALGGLRGAESVFAPLTLVVPAISLPGLPLVARVARKDPRRALRVSMELSAVAFAATSAYATLIALGGWRLLPLLFGESFARFRNLIWPIAVAQILTSAGVGLVLLMKAERRGRDLMMNRSMAAVISFGLVTTLAWRYGLVGAAWGAAGGALASLALLILATTRRPASPPSDAGNVTPIEVDDARQASGFV